MIAETERLIKAAGFGKDGPDHRAKIGLTEAEAAAVYASKQQFEVRRISTVPSLLYSPSAKYRIVGGRHYFDL